MRLYRTDQGCVVEQDGTFFLLTGESWDALTAREDLEAHLQNALKGPRNPAQSPLAKPALLLAPIGKQEVWAAGVTYYRSRDARMEESKSAGGGDFYARVYDADRPEIFFKSTPHRVAGPRQNVSLRKDSSWNVPEP